MSRNMIESNRALFSVLEKYCVLRGEPLQSPGKRRYVSANEDEKALLRNLKVGTCLRFGNHRSLTHLTLGDAHYIGVVGFDFEISLSTVSTIDSNAGYTVCILTESRTGPSASPPSIRNIVEAGDMDDPDYAGHSSILIESLFPSVRRGLATLPSNLFRRMQARRLLDRERSRGWTGCPH
jgi:hypothetical protein